MTNYYHIPAEGQLDDKACWAACLKWWLTAAKSINKPQRSIIDEYIHLTDNYGTLQDASMGKFIELNGLKKVVYEKARQFTSDELWKHLQKGPVYIAFTETSKDSKHVNVIHDIAGTVENPTLTVMEPQAKELPDLSYKGEHQIKPLSEFNRKGKVIIGAMK